MGVGWTCKLLFVNDLATLLRHGSKVETSRAHQALQDAEWLGASCVSLITGL